MNDTVCKATNINKSDFTECEMVDIEAIHAEMLAEDLNKSKQFLIDNEDYQKYKSFIKKYKKTPTIGNSYIYCSIFFIPIAKRITVSCFSKLHELVNIENGVFVFNVNGLNKKYPETENDSGDLLKTTLLFDSIKSKEKVLSLLDLKYSEWSIKEKLIES
jgi:hypothetical protein